MMNLFMLGFAVAPRSGTVILRPVLCLSRPVGQFSGLELFPTNRPKPNSEFGTPLREI